MNYVLLVEQQGRQNVVKLDVTEEEPVIVGRSWQCDVVVIDQYVDAEHLKISANDDSQLIIEDLQSENGTRLEKKAVDDAITYKVGDEIVVGETTLRLIDADSDVQSAVRFENIVRFARRFGTVPSAVIATICAACMILVFVYWTGSDYVSRPDLLEGSLSAFGFFLGWCFVGGVLSKLGRGKSFLLLHWTFLCAFFSIAVVSKFGENYLNFNVGSTFFASVTSHILGVIYAAALVYGILTLISKLGRKKKMAFTLCAIAVMLFFDIGKPMLEPEHKKWSAYVNVNHVGLPPTFFIGKTQTIDTHFEKTNDLFDRLTIGGAASSSLIEQ